MKINWRCLPDFNLAAQNDIIHSNTVGTVAVLCIHVGHGPCGDKHYYTRERERDWLAGTALAWVISIINGSLCTSNKSMFVCTSAVHERASAHNISGEIILNNAWLPVDICNSGNTNHSLVEKVIVMTKSVGYWYPLCEYDVSYMVTFGGEQWA